MINVDSKKGEYEFDGSMIDVITDIGYAIFNVASSMEKISKQNWNDTLDRLMGTLKGAVNNAHEEAKKLGIEYTEAQNDTYR